MEKHTFNARFFHRTAVRESLGIPASELPISQPQAQIKCIGENMKKVPVPPCAIFPVLLGDSFRKPRRWAMLLVLPSLEISSKVVLIKCKHDDSPEEHQRHGVYFVEQNHRMEMLGGISEGCEDRKAGEVDVALECRNI